jgi:hypothetical protein
MYGSRAHGSELYDGLLKVILGTADRAFFNETIALVLNSESRLIRLVLRGIDGRIR